MAWSLSIMAIPAVRYIIYKKTFPKKNERFFCKWIPLPSGLKILVLNIYLNYNMTPVFASFNSSYLHCCNSKLLCNNFFSGSSIWICEKFFNVHYFGGS